MGGLLGPLFGSLGGLFANNALSGSSRQLRRRMASNPTSVFGPFGNLLFRGNQAFVHEDGAMSAMRDMLGSQGLGLLGGGLFNNANFQSAFNNNDIQGAFQGADSALQQQIGNTAFGGLEGLFNNASGLSNLFSQQLAQGPQDLTGGFQNALFQQGFDTLNSAGDLSGLIQQNLDASRLLAEPFETNLVNRFNNQEFMRTGGGTSGAFDRQSDLQDNLLRSDAQRVLGAQQLGLQGQGQLQQLGLGQLGLGSNIMGQNLGFFNNLGGLAQGFSGLASGLEGQQFGQMLQSLQQNQSAGQQRLSNALGLFGLGNDTFAQNFNLGLGAHSSILGQNQGMLQGILGLLNADANRIGAQGQFSGALAGLGSQRGGLLGGLLGGIGSLF